MHHSGKITTNLLIQLCWVFKNKKQVKESDILIYKVTILFVLLSFFAVFNGITQINNIDSLKSNVHNSSDSIKFKIFLEIAKEYQYNNYDSVIFYGNNYLPKLTSVLKSSISSDMLFLIFRFRAIVARNHFQGHR